MGVNKKAYILAKDYTDESIIGFGVQKGANCQIKSIVHKNGQNIVTFLWKNEDDVERETVMYVEDGTNIYTYTVGDTYTYGDLVIYQSAFYRCVVEEYVAEEVIDHTCFNEIGSPDGNFDIVENATLLPPRFTEADRKMYYSIADMAFYLWNGYTWVKQIRKASYESLGMVMIDEETMGIDENGKLYIRTIEDSDINALFE